MNDLILGYLRKIGKIFTKLTQKQAILLLKKDTSISVNGLVNLIISTDKCVFKLYSINY